MSKAKIIFFGTSEFAVPSLEKLIEAGYAPLFVVTKPDKPIGREKKLKSPPVKLKAQELSLPVKQPSKLDEKFIQQVEKTQAAVLVVVAYGKLLPKKLLATAKLGAINIHPSLLPKYRGPSPIQTAILNLDPKTGVTLMKLDEGMDSGPIIAQKEVKILDDDDAISMANCLAVFGAQLLIDNLENYFNQKVTLTEQDESLASESKLIEREDGHVNWSKSTKQILAQFRALKPWPGIFSYLGKKRLKLTKIKPYRGQIDNKFQPGDLFINEKSGDLIAKSSDGALVLTTVQLEGKKEITGPEFVNGLKGSISSLS
ncbi:MAG: methionyl-tRNA formyltransferase [Candidatus Buchananbacteria bacterium CG10_big_fil_rev_8_21_14_0_10_42_9]|uniref:Methionyl-tRNA formyltransferase n=1 Tax=Candidatus Buchananbacteria bacterium CG10_big_fil_rev_8_21_14_0_10_42_9 TaxID=1974526 RepID=A0A2H0W112_9BACT|nr:MAG: methionyl-tRNA formyltransferase [Candidatus Buchananbacteria bacterium CG10_big_fil_rev_8_21_14_0_10_42_9]